jgi:hypothetical protein
MADLNFDCDRDPSKGLRNLVEDNASEEAWLADLLNEFMADYPAVPKAEAIGTLSAVIKTLSESGSIGVFSYVFSNANAPVIDVSPIQLEAVLAAPENWEYRHKEARVYALFLREELEDVNNSDAT